MSRFRDALLIANQAARLPDPQMPRKLEAAIREVRSVLGKVTPREPSRFDLDVTRNRLMQISSNRLAFAQLETSHLKRVPWLIFEPDPDTGEIFADDQVLLKSYLAELMNRASAAAILTLAVVFLRYYPRRSAFFNYLMAAIGSLVSALKTVKGVSFAQRCQQFRLFEPDGPVHFAKIQLESDSPDQVLDAAGFDGFLREKGFVEVAAGELLGLIQNKLSNATVSPSWLMSRINYFELGQGGSATGHRFPNLRVLLAESLLLPFRNKACPNELKDTIKSFLIKQFNDPRLNKAEWQAVSNDALVVIKRWLVDATLEDFFRVVTQGTQGDSDADRMWPYRQAFWNAYLKRGVISEAWVVLGYDVARRARNFLTGHEQGYGKLASGSQARPSHAVLIMRIGDLIITEWSHMGKYRLWHADNRNAPKLYKYKQSYSRRELVNEPDMDGSHHNPENATWQRTLASLINDWTGVLIAYKEYMPRGR
jgi:hypothetical protein